MALDEKLKKVQREVTCAKCGRRNPARTNMCQQCGARLYISCHHCGHSNLRAASHCTECGNRLHRSLWRRMRKRLFGRNPKITPLQILLLIVFVFFAYKVIVYLAEYKPPAYEAQ